jgi:hypothetical protein
LIARYLWGLRGEDLIEGEVVSSTATRSIEEMEAYLAELHILEAFDVDADGLSLGDTDGHIIARYIFGLRGEDLIEGVMGENATRGLEEILDFLALIAETP